MRIMRIIIIVANFSALRIYPISISFIKCSVFKSTKSKFKPPWILLAVASLFTYLIVFCILSVTRFGPRFL